MQSKILAYVVAAFIVGAAVGASLGLRACPQPVTVTSPTPVPAEAVLGEIYRREDVTLAAGSGFYLIYRLTGTLTVHVRASVPVEVSIMDFNSFGKWFFAGKPKKFIKESVGTDVYLQAELPYLDYYVIVVYNPSSKAATIYEITVERTI